MTNMRGVGVAPVDGLMPLARLDFDPVAGFEERIRDARLRASVRRAGNRRTAASGRDDAVTSLVPGGIRSSMTLRVGLFD